LHSAISSSVKELIEKIEQFVVAYDKTKAPFQWTATADSILEKLQRLCSQISGTAH
jgi:putative transposase